MSNCYNWSTESFFSWRIPLVLSYSFNRYFWNAYIAQIKSQTNERSDTVLVSLTYIPVITLIRIFQQYQTMTVDEGQINRWKCLAITAYSILKNNHNTTFYTSHSNDLTRTLWRTSSCLSSLLSSHTLPVPDTSWLDSWLLKHSNLFPASFIWML